MNAKEAVAIAEASTHRFDAILESIKDKAARGKRELVLRDYEDQPDGMSFAYRTMDYASEDLVKLKELGFKVSDTTIGGNPIWWFPCFGKTEVRPYTLIVSWQPPFSPHPASHRQTPGTSKP